MPNIVYHPDEIHQPRPLNQAFDEIKFGLAVDDEATKNYAHRYLDTDGGVKGTEEYYYIARIILGGKYGLGFLEREKAINAALAAAQETERK